ncbi:cytochrome P450 [Streptomyces sp. 5.8]|uniref:cytochrome P450 n=1 Tax=Streptomyces sp. 5.8 TaxID=3406571 RepID=UPI003BB6A290
MNNIITERRTDGQDHGDLLSSLLGHGHDDGEPTDPGLTDSQVSDQVITFFIAGTETGAGALSWAFWMLAEHPEIERRVQAEADAVLAGRAASFADLPQLELAGRVITEVLRLYTPVWLLNRIVTTDTALGGHTLKAGETVAFSPHLIHHREDLYEDAQTFDPDRWDPAKRTPPARNAFIAFGGGARQVHRRPVRHHRGNPGPRHHHHTLAAVPRARREGPTVRVDHRAAGRYPHDRHATPRKPRQRGPHLAVRGIARSGDSTTHAACNTVGRTDAELRQAVRLRLAPHAEPQRTCCPGSRPSRCIRLCRRRRRTWTSAWRSRTPRPRRTPDCSKVRMGCPCSPPPQRGRRVRAFPARSSPSGEATQSP